MLRQRSFDMEMDRMRMLAGVSQPVMEAEKMLDESVSIPEEASIEDIMMMMDAARRGLGLANKLKDIDQKARHVRAIFINLNKIRAALRKFM